MFTKTALLTACVLAASGLVSAAPSQRVGCTPNFEGAGVSIIDGGIEWGVSPAVAGTLLNRILGSFPLNATAEWHVQQTGAFPVTYYVKEINHNDLVVDIDSEGLLILEELDSSKATQTWSLTCATCRSGASSTPSGGEFASSCQIVNAGTGLCARAEPAGLNYGTGPCESDTVLQSFDFWTATSA